MYLCGYVTSTDKDIVVYASEIPFSVQPPDRREIWVTVPGQPTDVAIGDSVRVSLKAPGRFDARLINIYRRAEAAPENEKVEDTKSPPSSRSKNTKAENLFKNAVKNLKRGRQEKALELFEQAKAEDPSEEMAQRIEAALRENPGPSK